MIRRGCERPLFLRIGSVIRGRRIGQEGGGHLVGEAAEVVVDLDLDASETGGVPGQLIAPLSLPDIDLMGQLRRDVVQGDNKGAGLGSGVDLHRRLTRAGGRQDMRLCYRDPEAITTFRESTPRNRNSDDLRWPCRPRPAYISRYSRFIGRSTALLVRWHPGWS